MEEENWLLQCKKCDYNESFKYEIDFRKREMNFICPSCNNKRRLTCFSVAYYMKNGYSLEESKKIISDKQSKISNKVSKESREKIGINSPYKISSWIKKGFTEKEAIEKIKTYKKFYVEYWTSRGFSNEDAIKKVYEFQSRASKSVNFKTKLNANHLQYWLNKGFSEEESRKHLHNRQSTFTLEKCITKHGIEKGSFIFNERQRKWKEKVYGENGCIANSYSKPAILLAEKLKDLYPSIRYCKNKEWFIWDKNYNKVFLFDICVPELKKIIEFNGDFWHMNPKIYHEDFINPVTKISAKEKWKLDDYKNDVAKKHGYEVLIIWESELSNDQDKTIEICKSFLLQNAL